MKALSVCAALLAIGVCGCSHRNPAPAPSPDGLSSPLNWERIKECAAQAEHEFLAEGFKRGDEAGRTSNVADFTNHFDQARQKCFMLVEATNFPFQTKTLSDAYEGRVYAQYVFKADDVKKYWEVAPLECWILSETGEKRQCKSGEQFDKEVEAYMGAPKPPPK